MENSMSISIPSGNKNMRLSDFVKRLLDITVSLTVLTVLLPFYVFIAVAIKRDSPGPIFYRGLRIGRKRKYFKILKFRTMYETKKSYSGPKVTAQDDPRVTPFGRWLRDTKLNEFPQFWNVLIGDMSLVGPRPEDPEIANTWPREVSSEIHSVRPGITSPASVLYRNEENMLHASDVLQKYLHELTPDKIRLDQLYVRNRSFWLDLDVIFWTALLLLPKIKAFSPPEKILFVGPVTRIIQRYTSWFLWDFLIVFMSIGISGLVMRLFGPLHLGWLLAFQVALIYSLLYSLVGALLGVNTVNWSKATAWDSARLFFGWILVTGTAMIVHQYLHNKNLLNFSLILSASTLSLLGVIFVRYRSRLMVGLVNRIIRSRVSTSIARERILIIGSGRTAEHTAWLLAHPTYSNKFQIVGIIDDDVFSQDLNIYGTKVIGIYQDIPNLIKEYDVGIILLADHRISLEEYNKLTDIAASNTTKLIIVPDVFGALKSLFVVPPFQTFTSEELNGNKSPCNYCIGKYSRLEIERQLDEWDKTNNGKNK
jgi:lipopolysaccharide/colanic/teichoic acid biosynthesis glycosyltransferase